MMSQTVALKMTNLTHIAQFIHFMYILLNSVVVVVVVVVVVAEAVVVVK